VLLNLVLIDDPIEGAAVADGEIGREGEEQ
jgi:hypothetical protein